LKGIRLRVRKRVDAEPQQHWGHSQWGTQPLENRRAPGEPRGRGGSHFVGTSSRAEASHEGQRGAKSGQPPRGEILAPPTYVATADRQRT